METSLLQFPLRGFRQYGGYQWGNDLQVTGQAEIRPRDMCCHCVSRPLATFTVLVRYSEKMGFTDKYELLDVTAWLSSAF